jgi:hypothetical protein
MNTVSIQKNINETNQKESVMEDIIREAIPVFKQYIKDNSKPAMKDKEYGNKLDPYLNGKVFAIYAVLRGVDFKKGLHSKAKVDEVVEALSKRSDFQENRNYFVNGLVDKINFKEKLSQEEIVDIKEYVVNFFENVEN